MSILSYDSFKKWQFKSLKCGNIFSRYLDFISVKTFDFHTFKDGIARHHSPLYSAVHDEENINSNTVSIVIDIKHYHLSMGFKTSK